MGERIIAESGSHSCHNMGDVAMMQAAVERISHLWPSAQVEIVTKRPDLLAHFCPAAAPIPFEERNAWLCGRELAAAFQQKLPPALSRKFVSLQRAIWLRFPRTADLAVGVKSRLLKRDLIPPGNFRGRLSSANLFVVCGMGVLNDSFTDVAIPLLDEMEAALEAGVPVVAFGQGIGPINDHLLLERARAVLPRLTFISLRESVMGLPLLTALGVPHDKIMVTGDDAVEMAFRARPARPGNAIGVSMRLVHYAGTDHETIDRLSVPLHAVAELSKRPLIPIPISFAENEADAGVNQRLLGDRWQTSLAEVRSPEDAIRLAGSCRAVVTGTYHAGVFALSQGVPIVGLIQSPYYEQKFQGLQQQFPEGCWLLDLRQPLSPQEIESAILAALDSADATRESLLAAAARQIETGRQAYQTARKLCSLKSPRAELSLELSSGAAG